MNNHQWLHEYMKVHMDSSLDVTRIYRVTLTTVKKWLQLEASDQCQEIPDKYLDLLETKLIRGG